MRKIFVCASDLIKIYQFSSKVGLIKIQNYHLSRTGPCPAIRRPKSATIILGRIPHPRFQKKMTRLFADVLTRSQIPRRRGSRFISQSFTGQFQSSYQSFSQHFFFFSLSKSAILCRKFFLSFDSGKVILSSSRWISRDVNCVIHCVTFCPFRELTSVNEKSVWLPRVVLTRSASSST